MKKFYAIICCALVSASMTASVQVVDGSSLLPLRKSAEIRDLPGVTRTLDGKASVSGMSKITATGEDPDTGLPIYHPDGEWQSLGTGTYYEGLFTEFDAPSDLFWPVEIEESVEVPGWYRLQPYKEGTPVADIVGYGEDRYMYVNATDPDMVWIEDYVCFGLQYHFCQLVPETWDGPGYYEYGVLEDGVLNFEDAMFVTWYVERWNLCGDDKFKIALPGVHLPDYRLQVVSDFCANDNKPWAGMIVGEDIAELRVGIGEGILDVYYENSEIVAAEGMSMSPETTEMTFTFDKRGMYSVYVVGLDDKGNIVAAATDVMFAEVDDADQWEPLGRGYWQEGVISPRYDELSMMQVNVDIERHKTIEGYYRLVNPLKEHSVLNAYTVQHSGHNHYIYVNASDPDAVYIEPSAIGFETANYGPGAIWSHADHMMSQGYEKEYLQSYGIFGSMSQDGVITFPDDMLLFAEKGFYSGRFLPSGDRFKIDLYNTVPGSGVQDVVSETDAPVEYFNLQGIRVDNPSGGVYIRRQGGTVSKEIIP